MIASHTILSPVRAPRQGGVVSSRQSNVGAKRVGSAAKKPSSKPMLASFGSSSVLGDQLSVRKSGSSRLGARTPMCCVAMSESSVGPVSLVLLAGGVGKRMGANMPKQYLPLSGQPIATYSLDIFSQIENICEIIVVCDPSYRDIFTDFKLRRDIPVKFALPGAERQDSVFNGFQEISRDSELVAIHDSARPLVTCEEILAVFADAAEVGAAVLGVQCKATVKEASGDGMVIKTLDRSKLWEMHTPQVIRPAILAKGFAYVKENNLEVTDDVSIVEHLGEPVRITKGSYENLKVTTPEDMLIAERLLADRRE